MLKKVLSALIIAVLVLSGSASLFGCAAPCFVYTAANEENEITAEHTAETEASAEHRPTYNLTRIIAKAVGDEPDIHYVKCETVGGYTVYDFANEADAAAAFGILSSCCDDVSYSVNAYYCDTGEAGFEYLISKYGMYSWVNESGIKNARVSLLGKYGSVDNMPTVTVGIIDSGIDISHELFAGRINSAEHDFTESQNDATDTLGHGTGVAGVIADMTMPNVKINAYRVGDGDISDVAVVKAVRQAISDNVRIINISINIPGASAVLKEALDEAIAAGITVVVSAGNDSSDAVHSFPASYEPAITVSALDYDSGALILADYSNYGSNIDIAAYGKYYTASLGGGYGEESGTSFASPVVAAAAAMYLTYYPDATSYDVERWLKTGAKDFGNDGFDMSTGYGVLNMSSFSSDSLAPSASFSDTDTMHDMGFTLNISADPGYSIYYTVDGTLPVKNGNPVGTLYSSPIQVSRSADLTVAVVGNGVVPNISRMRYYVAGECLPSDFSVREGFIRQYYGSFQKVTLPTSIYGQKIFGFEETFRDDTPVKEVIIPDGIKYIGDCAFSHSTVERVVIGKDVIAVGEDAFIGCKAEVVVSPANTHLKTDGKTIYSDVGVLYYYDDRFPTERYQLPDAVTRLKLDYFNECGNLGTLVLGKNVTDINFRFKINSFTEGVGINYWNYLSHPVRFDVVHDNPLFSADASGMLYSKDKSVLYYCPSNYTGEYRIPGQVKTVSGSAFASMGSFDRIVFEEGVEEVFGSFDDCNSMPERNIYFPSTVTYVAGIGKCYTDALHIWFAGDAPVNLHISDESGIYVHCYPGAKGFDELKSKLTNVTFLYRTDGTYKSRTVEYPFAGGTLIFDTEKGKIVSAVGVSGDITLPDTINGTPVRIIGASAFRNSDIGNLVIPAGVTEIHTSAFEESSVKSVRILGDVKEIGESAFFECRSLTFIEIAGNTEIIGAHAFELTLDKADRTVILPDSVRILGEGCLADNNLVNMLKLPDSLEVIGENSLNGFIDGATRRGPVEITLPKNLKVINSAFDGSMFTRIVFNIGALEHIASNAFGNLYSDNKCLVIHLTENLPDDAYLPFPGAYVFCDEGVTISEQASIGTVVLPISQMENFIGDRRTFDNDGWEHFYVPPHEHTFSEYVIDGFFDCDMDISLKAVCDYPGCSAIDWKTEPATGHSFTNYVSDNNATCSKDGTKTAKCDRCDCTDTILDEGTALGHIFINYVSDNNATCTRDGTKTAHCERDGCPFRDIKIDDGTALGHSFTNYVSDNNATDKSAGTKTAHCDHPGCKETDTVLVDPNELNGKDEVGDDSVNGKYIAIWIVCSCVVLGGCAAALIIRKRKLQ